MTENHDLKLPEQGTLDWHIPLNENFGKIDTAVEIRDVESARDQYVPKKSAKFLATDTGTRYLGDGTQWTEAPAHLPDLLAAPSAENDPEDAALGEIWYREDTGELKVQMSTGAVVLASAPPATEEDDGEMHTLEIFGTGSPSHFEFSVSGELEPESATFEPRGDEYVDGSTAVGWVTEPSHLDRFFFSGQITRFGYQSDSEGSVRLVLDGTEYDDSEIVGQPSG